MNPYIQFDIRGLSVILDDEDGRVFPVDSDARIESAELLLDEHNNIVGIQVNFSDDTIIDSRLIDDTETVVELFVAHVICELDASVGALSIEGKCAYNPNQPPNDGVLRLSSTIEIGCSATVTSTYGLERYKNLFTDSIFSSNAKYHYLLLNNIMSVDNMVLRYLMQYEFLKSLMSPSEGHKRVRQRDVTAFIRDKYNPSPSTYRKIGMHLSSLPDKNFEQDDLTHYRNILAHNGSSRLPENYERAIRTLSSAMTKVIYFAIQRLPQEEE